MSAAETQNNGLRRTVSHTSLHRERLGAAVWMSGGSMAGSAPTRSGEDCTRDSA